MQRVPLISALGALLLLTNANEGVGRGTPRAENGWRATTGATLPDSAQEELDAGRYWHAARAFRAEGAAQGDPARVLLLARAEAGWSNWPAVVTLLEGADWLDRESDGAGWLLLGRGREDAARWATAASAYENFLADTSRVDARRAPALARLARVSARAGVVDAALAALDRIEPGDAYLRSWTGAELAQTAAEDADTAAVRQLLQRVTDAEARSASWRALPAARLAAGDSSGAQRALREALDFLTGARRADASVEAGRLALAHGDSALARTLLLDGLEEASPANEGRAASTLVDLGGNDVPTTLNLARVLESAGNGASALAAYDRAHADAERTGIPFADGPRLARARLMATVRERQDEALAEFRSLDATTIDPSIGARNLEVWAAMRARQSRAGDVTTIQRWLVERYPSSPQAAEVVWRRGIEAEFDGSISKALEEYALVARNARTNQRAGQARMRTGQIRIAQGRIADAAEVYETYLTDFPDGVRWDEASFWAARTRLELGDTAAARRLVDRILSEQPVSYYAVMGADLLDQPYDLAFPEGDGPIEPEWLTEGLRRIDLLTEAGLEVGAVSEQQALIARSRGSKPVMLALAEALLARGRTITGINLGWDIRAEGHPWDRRLLRVVYPFPYRVLVEREAAEWGADPLVMAAMIRQESAFDARIVSRAGAIGLMQVMPPTGRELARAHGPIGFRDVNLTTAEVNLHLGAVFFRDMSRRYDGSLPLVLSAYNAGPTRATRWRVFPEATDHARFAERVPIEETRGYLKNVRRNLGIYRALYPS